MPTIVIVEKAAAYDFGRRLYLVDYGARTPTTGGRPLMSWLSDTYTELKALYQRFVQWERLALLREREWRFPIYGTVEDFEQRFKFLVPQVFRDEFFNMHKRRKTSGHSGFCERGEVAVNVPNPRSTGSSKKFLDRETSIYHFHGSLNQDRGGLYLYGHFRLPHQIARGVLRMINSCLIYGAIVFIVAAAAYGVEILTSVVSTHFFYNALISYLPFFALFFFLMSLMNCLLVRRLERRDRHARAEAYRLLTEICGSPATPPNHQP
ncbi:MAG: hypothetical protein O7B24_00980 [Alphaproteobacteria bacterium]|nr:hypothetical protein [Alphaproteobacteria bacterium]